MESFNNSIIDEMRRYVGQTVTIFTTSGGLSGAGFTGVLISADCNNVKLLCSIGWAPSCPLGSVTIIPTCAIASFTHNAI